MEKISGMKAGDGREAAGIFKKPVLRYEFTSSGNSCKIQVPDSGPGTGSPAKADGRRED